MARNLRVGARLAPGGLAVALAAAFTPAVAAAASFVLRTRMGTFSLQGEPMPPMTTQGTVVQAQALAHGDAGLVLVHFDGPIGEAQRQALAALGVQVRGYYPDDTLLVSVDGADQQAELAAVAGVAQVVDPPVWLKFEPALLQDSGQGEVALLPAPGAAPRDLVLEATDAEAQAALALRVAAVGAEVVAATDGSTSLRVRMDDAAIAAVAADPGLLHVGVDRPVRTCNKLESGVIQAGVADQRPIWGHGLRGQGRTVGIADGDFFFKSCYFSAPSKVKAISWLNQPTPTSTAVDEQMEHGTHVAGIVAGDYMGNGVADLAEADHAEDGQAPAASLVLTAMASVSDPPGQYAVPTDFEILLKPSLAQGARVQNGSYNTAVDDYTASSRGLDAGLFNHPEVLGTFAAGNDGPMPSTLGDNANAKNVLVLGAYNAGTPQEIWEHSSRGPTKDQRLRPHVMLPGDMVLSASWLSDCGAQMLSGTSMAAPAAAGAAALVGQYYAEGFAVAGKSQPGAGAEASGALVKATLLASTEFMTTPAPAKPVPSMDQGFGRVNLSRVLWFADQGTPTLWTVDAGADKALATGGSASFMLWNKGGADFRVVLTWYDVPAMLAAQQTIVNDLDLSVTAPDGTVYCGNNWVTTVAAADSRSAPGADKWDRLNTEEVVHLPKADPGGYTVRVDAHNVPSGRQAYALVARGALGDRPNDAAVPPPQGGDSPPQPPPTDGGLVNPAGPTGLSDLPPRDFTASSQAKGGCAASPLAAGPLAGVLLAAGLCRAASKKRPRPPGGRCRRDT